MDNNKTKQISRGFKIVLLLSLICNVLFLMYGIKKIYVRNRLRPFLSGGTIKLITPEEYREYRNEKNSFFAKFPTNKNDIVFVGSSITEAFNVSEIIGHLKNRGIGGDESATLLQRLYPLVKTNPKKIFIEIGVNEVSNDAGTKGISNDSLVNNIERIFDTIKVTTRGTEIYFESILPVAENNSVLPSFAHKNHNIVLVNERIKALCLQKNVQFIDLYSLFVLNGEMNKAYALDGVHPSPEGYKIWQTAIQKNIDE